MDPVIQLLADLVAIPSMNPMGRGRSGEAYREERLARFIEQKLQQAGAAPLFVEVTPGRPNVSALLDAGAENTLLLEAHMDTVLADGMTDPFTPVVREGRLYGRGACDTKGSLAAFLHLFMSACQAKRRPRYNLLFLAVADEEYGFTGARYATQHGMHADFGIVGEPTSLHIVHAHKGVTRWRIVTHGVAAHSAYPERGHNAIYAMARVVERLETYAGTLTKGKRHPLLGTATLSVGVIEGGEAVNIVPDRCVIEVDRRLLPGELPDGAIAEVRALLTDLPEWTFDPPHLAVAGVEVERTAPVLLQLASAIEAVTGTTTVETAQYATDAGIYGSEGTPCVVFGPGDIARAHTVEEYCELDQVLQAAAILERMVL